MTLESFLALLFFFVCCAPLAGCAVTEARPIAQSAPFSVTVAGDPPVDARPLPTAKLRDLDPKKPRETFASHGLVPSFGSAARRF